MKKIITLLISLCLLISLTQTALAEETASSETESQASSQSSNKTDENGEEMGYRPLWEYATLINDFSDISTVAADKGMTAELSADSPDGSCLKLGYSQSLALTVKSTVEKEKRAADADKNYLCFWIKTPNTVAENIIFFGLIENSMGDKIGQMEMIWNGNSQENFYVGKIIAVSNTGEKEYLKPGKCLRLKPGFEGYIAIPIRSAMDIHPDWEVDGTFDYTSVSSLRIWFESNETAANSWYFFDNFYLAKNEFGFEYMMKEAGLTVSDQEKQETSSSETTSSEESEPESVVENTSSEEEADESGDGGAGREANNKKPIILIIIIAVAVLLMATSVIFKLKISKTDEESSSDGENIQ
ncbi:MAG: hypothetical protein IKD04_07845 [Clostridia bacterium]|nr:hypothetical protein [Clostridia bacterium]